MSKFWQRLSTNTLLAHPRITVVEDEVLLPTGSKTKYVRFENIKDYVTVVAVRAGKIAMIKEYSYPLDKWLLQFPEGSIEQDETPKIAATRELKEEAGLAADEVQILGINYDHHRRSTAKDFIILTKGVTKTAKPPGDEEEFGTSLHWVSRQQIVEMLKTGEIVQKNAVAALALCFAHKVV